MGCIVSLLIHILSNKHFHNDRFHALAFIATTRTIISGCTFALPLCVGFPPKPNELLHNLQVKNGITILITVPSLLEQLVQEILSGKNHSVNFKPLANLRAVAYGGASCPDELCQILVDNGVVLLNVYGSTGEQHNHHREKDEIVK